MPSNAAKYVLFHQCTNARSETNKERCHMLFSICNGPILNRFLFICRPAILMLQWNVQYQQLSFRYLSRVCFGYFHSLGHIFLEQILSVLLCVYICRMVKIWNARVQFIGTLSEAVLICVQITVATQFPVKCAYVLTEKRKKENKKRKESEKVSVDSLHANVLCLVFLRANGYLLAYIHYIHRIEYTLHG